MSPERLEGVEDPLLVVAASGEGRQILDAWKRRQSCLC
jgi:hypothetical protein